MSVKFTPGPWEAQGNGIWRSTNKHSVAFVTVYKPDLSDGSEAAATVRLIAAAPEMYELLEKIASFRIADRSCSLEAQGYDEVACMEYSTKDYFASMAIDMLKKINQ